MARTYSDKQLALMRLWQQDKLARLNILEGSVRSGKTWISLVMWAFWVAASPADGDYLMVAKTLQTLRRNCLDLLVTQVGGDNFSYSLSRKEGRLFGRRVYLEGASDARSENKIRGMTLQGAYCDELTLFPQEFFAMLLSRLSAPQARLIATTNPDSPRHWLMTDYLQRADELNLLRLCFLIDDNPFLDPGYIASLKNEYRGVFYDRFILGRWVLAQGVIYGCFDKARHVTDLLPTTGRYYISVDYGTVNPCSMGLWCCHDGTATRIREYYYDSRNPKNQGVQLTDEEYYSELTRLAGGLPIQAVVVDPSAASFITCIRRHKRFPVRKANNDVLSGIRHTAGLLQQGRLLFHTSCTDSIREFGLYVWDVKAGTDRPIKEHDHAMDEIRYFCTTVPEAFVPKPAIARPKTGQLGGAFAVPKPRVISMGQGEQIQVI